MTARPRTTPRKPPTGKTAQTRRAMMRATIETIRELGYYRATSNEIARRAGLTWGAIQHHFGSREALILAVLESVIDDVNARFAAVSITGDTLAARLHALWDMYMSFYAHPDYLATLQILLDLTHDPAFGARARKAVKRYTVEFDKQAARLAPQVWRDTPADPEEVMLFFGLMWGLGVGARVSEAMSTVANADATLEAVRRRVIARFATPAPAAAKRTGGRARASDRYSGSRSAGPR